MTQAQTENLATLGDITTALDAQKFPKVDKTVISAISRTGREEFLGNLAACVSGQDSDGSRRNYLQGLLCCLTDEALAALRALQLNPELDDLVRIAAKTPARLATAIAAAHDLAHPRNAEAKEYLKAVLVPPPPPAAETPAAPLPPASAEDNQAPPESPIGPPPEESAPSSVRFRSAHVYGSNYALCFNAGIGRDQRPGIMVDAAVSNGPRAYDWRNAIHIWLNEKEVACVLAVFRRWRKSVEFSAHGAANDKTFILVHQDGHFFCKVSATKEPKDKVRAVKIIKLDANEVSILFLEQLLLAYPQLPPSEVLEQVRLINLD
ncbi:MAG: hypothetical protein IT512_04390 [Rhodocyclaceae bacterium]|nr:hypothetical protein [Rhodocyclaceae bacterium]